MKKHTILLVLLSLALFICGCSADENTQDEKSGNGSTAADITTADPASESSTLPVTQEATQPLTAPDTDAATEPSVPDITAAEYEIGTINAKDGLANTSNRTRLHNPAYIPIADAAGVIVKEGYQLTWLAYGADKTYLGNGNNYKGLWQPEGGPIRTSDILNVYPNAAYFRYAIKNTGGTDVTLSDVEKSGVAVVPAGKEEYLKAPEKPAKTITYTGSGISPEKKLTLSELPAIPSGQDGAIFGNLLFRFGSSGSGKVVSLPLGNTVGTVTMDRTDLICPHSNSVSFGTKYYAEGDEFPLLYSNVYNTYASSSDRKLGYCCVYRLTRNGTDFRASLVQVIRVGFADDLSLWASKPNYGDVRPYGNFVADDKDDILWAFVMRDADRTTRVFSFNLPDPTEGTADPFLGNVPVVTLEEKDILKKFDGGYSNYIQGATVLDGLIYSLEGFTDAKKSSPPAIRVFDTKAGTEAAFVDLYGEGYTIEPEFISVYNGVLYYSDANGKLLSLEFN